MNFRGAKLFFVCSCLPAMSIAASNLALSFSNPTNALMTIEIHKAASSSPYYKLNYNLTVVGTNGKGCSTSASSKSIYHHYFRKLYLVDNHQSCDTNANIASAKATISVESCDKAFEVCNAIGTYSLTIQYEKDKIIGVSPKTLDISL